MFDIGWSEMAVIALLTLIVIGPKELPKVMRNVGQWVRKAQSLAREFQHGLDDMAREAELEDAKKLVDAGRSIANPKKMLMDTLDPTGSVQDEAKDLQASVTAEAPSAGTPEGGGDKSPPAKSTDEGKAEVKDEPAVTAKDGVSDKTAAKVASEPKPKTTPAPKKKTAATTTAKKRAAKVAPAKSVKPPSEPAAGATSESAPAGSNGSQKTA